MLFSHHKENMLPFTAAWIYPWHIILWDKSQTEKDSAARDEITYI